MQRSSSPMQQRLAVTAPRAAPRVGAAAPPRIDGPTLICFNIPASDGGAAAGRVPAPCRPPPRHLHVGQLGGEWGGCPSARRPPRARRAPLRGCSTAQPPAATTKQEYPPRSLPRRLTAGVVTAMQPPSCEEQQTCTGGRA